MLKDASPPESALSIGTEAMASIIQILWSQRCLGRARQPLAAAYSASVMLKMEHCIAILKEAGLLMIVHSLR